MWVEIHDYGPSTLDVVPCSPNTPQFEPLSYATQQYLVGTPNLDTVAHVRVHVEPPLSRHRDTGASLAEEFRVCIMTSDHNNSSCFRSKTVPICAYTMSSSCSVSAMTLPLVADGRPSVRHSFLSKLRLT